MYTTAANQLSSIRDILRFAVSRFNEAELSYGHGTTNAFDEAVYLVLASLHLPVNQLEPYLEANLLQQEKEWLLEQIRRRVEEKIPVAYLINQAWQGAFSFYVDDRVIIPRSFIYELLGEPLTPWIEYPELVHRALDLCTGSGCLAIQMAHYYPDAQIDALDLSLDALEVAAINIEHYGLQDQIQLIHSNLFDGLDESYDLIIANPPYVNEESIDNLPPEYKKEPDLALASGKDGLDATRNILLNAANFMTDYGILVVEIGHNRDILENDFPDLPFKWLETSGGDNFVFLLEKKDLLNVGLVY